MHSSVPAEGAPAVLVVDDDADTRRLVTRWLENAGLVCGQAPSGSEALAMLQADPSRYFLVVLDVMMPGLNGLEVIEHMNQDEDLCSIPVIFLTAHAEDDADVVKTASLGAVDHLTKPFSGPVLTAKVQQAIRRHGFERRMARRLAAAEKLARIDVLTQLGNRQLFHERVREECAVSRRHRMPLCLAVLDIDHFKKVNDTLGHDAGDAALKHFAKLVSATVREGDGAFRYGGEEFIMLLRSCEIRDGLSVMRRLRVSLQLLPAVMPNGSELTLQFSAGLSCSTSENGYFTEGLFPRADRALYRAKEGGRNRDEVDTTPSTHLSVPPSQREDS